MLQIGDLAIPDQWPILFILVFCTSFLYEVSIKDASDWRSSDTSDHLLTVAADKRYTDCTGPYLLCCKQLHGCKCRWDFCIFVLFPLYFCIYLRYTDSTGPYRLCCKQLHGCKCTYIFVFLHVCNFVFSPYIFVYICILTGCTRPYILCRHAANTCAAANIFLHVCMFASL